MQNKPLTLPDRAIIELKKNPNTQITSRELAKKIVENKDNNEWLDTKYKNSKNRDKNTKKYKDKYAFLEALLAAEIGTDTCRDKMQKAEGISLYTSSYPAYWVFKQDKVNNKQNENSNATKKEDNDNGFATEEDSYEYFLIWLASEGIYANRINEKRSTNQNEKNELMWVHPDIVGVNFSQNKYSKIIEQSKQFKLYSYEVKQKITLSTYRQYFFQTVSNSAWANYSYLVINDQIEDKVYTTLKLLCNLYKIGLIVKSAEKESNEWQILKDAPYKEVDWDVIDDIIENTKNNDFKKFFEPIVDHQISTTETQQKNCLKNFDNYNNMPTDD